MKNQPTPESKEKPSERIRKIWEEMKELKRYQEEGFKDNFINEKYDKLFWKFEEIDTLFGHEPNLLKAIIYYLDEQYDKS